MALHPILSPTSAQTIARLGVTALRTAQSMQTRKGGSAFYPTGDGQGVLVGDMADHGVDKWDPETGEQNPLWEGISQEELDAKGDEILNAAKEDTAAQITIVNMTITEAQQAIEANRDGLEQEAYLRAEADRAARETSAAIKTETDKLKGDYDGMATDVASVKADMLEAASRLDTVEGTQEQQARDISTATTTATSAKTTAESAERTANAAKQLAEDNAAQTITGSVIEYAIGGATAAPTSGWTTNNVTRPAGATVWMRTRVTYGDGRTTVTGATPVTGDTGPMGQQGVQGATGETGPQGPAGPQGPQGVPGEPGEDGLPGAKGADGKTSYLHLAYANSADGTTGFSTTDSNRDYIGQYTDFVQSDSSDPSKYAWSKIKGAQGAQGLKGDPGATGLPGAPGADGRTSYAHFAYANSADGRTDFSTTNGVGKKYLGQYVDFVEADSTDPTKYTWSLIVGPQGPQGPQGVAGAKGDKGEDGITRYSYFAYATSASGADFSTTPTAASTYIGVCVSTSATQPTTPGSYTWSLTKGNTGEQGPQGPQGAAGAKGDVGEDGKTYYTYFAYGTSASGANFSTTPTESSTYIGVCITLAATQPTDPSKYTWSLTKGNTGAQGPQGPQGATGATGATGPQGATGATGVSVTAITPYYALAVSKPAKPAGKNPEGAWSTVEPALDRASSLWTSTRVDYSNGQWAWTEVTQSGAYKMAQAAQNSAEDAARLAQNADTLSQTTAGELDRLDKAHAITAATAETAAQNAASAQALLNVLSAQVEELLYNGGFEHGADGWKTNIASAGFVQQSGWCRSGGWRAYLNGSAGTRELVSTKPVAVTVGNRYRFRVWYKLLTALSGNDNGGLRLQYASAVTVTDNTVWTDFEPIVNMAFTGDTWTEAVQEAVIPDGVKWVRARIAFSAPVDAYIDDCSLSDVTLVHEAQQQADEATKLARRLETNLANSNARLEATEAAALGAQTTADSKNKRFVQATQPEYDLLKPGDEWWQTSSKPPETYWMGEPNNSVSVLVDHSDEVEHIWTWNGARWVDLMLAADSLFVRGTVSAGLVSADFFDGAVVKGGAFVTSNERIQLNNNGFVMVDSAGNPVVTLDAKTGEAILQSVNIIGAGISTPAISGGSIEGADYKLTSGTGANKHTVARINSDGILFGDHLSYAKNAQGQWVLSLAGAIQSGGEISSAVITAPTIQTSSAENTGLKLTTGGLVAYNTDGDTTFTLDNTGGIMMAGALLSNATLTAPLLQTDPANDRGIKIIGNTLTAFSRSGTPMLSLNGDTGSAVLVGGFKTAQSGRRLEITNSVYGDVSVGAIHGYDQVGESWHIVGTSDRTSPSEIDNWYTASLGIGINPQQPEINIRYENRYKATTMSLLADRIDIIGAGDGRNPYGDGVWVNNRRIDWEQSWTNLPLANGATAVGTAQYGQRAGLLVFRGRIKCTGNGDCDLFDLSSIYSGFETSSVNRTWIIGTMTKGVATTARAYIPANSTMLRVNNGPHDWVDIGSIVIGL